MDHQILSSLDQPASLPYVLVGEVDFARLQLCCLLRLLFASFEVERQKKHGGLAVWRFPPPIVPSSIGKGAMSCHGDKIKGSMIPSPLSLDLTKDRKRNEFLFSKHSKGPHFFSSSCQQTLQKFQYIFLLLQHTRACDSIT